MTLSPSGDSSGHSGLCPTCSPLSLQPLTRSLAHLCVFVHTGWHTQSSVKGTALLSECQLLQVYSLSQISSHDWKLHSLIGNCRCHLENPPLFLIPLLKCIHKSEYFTRKVLPYPQILESRFAVHPAHIYCSPMVRSWASELKLYFYYAPPCDYLSQTNTLYQSFIAFPIR